MGRSTGVKRYPHISTHSMTTIMKLLTVLLVCAALAVYGAAADASPQSSVKELGAGMAAETGTVTCPSTATVPSSLGNLPLNTNYCKYGPNRGCTGGNPSQTTDHHAASPQACLTACQNNDACINVIWNIGGTADAKTRCYFRGNAAGCPAGGVAAANHVLFKKT